MDRPSDVPDWLATLAESLAAADDITELKARFITFSREVIGARATGLYVLKPHTLTVQAVATHGVSDFFLTRYEEAGRDMDPVLERVLREKAAVDNRQIMSPEEWRRSPFYREVMHLHSFDYIVQAPVVCDDTILGVLIFAGPSAWHGGTQVRSVATAIGRIVGVSLVSLRKRAAAERDRDQAMRALDLVSEAVVVSDARTGKRYHNSPAQRLLGELRDHGVEHFDDLIADRAAHDGVSSVVMPVSPSVPGGLELSVQSILAEDDAATTISFLTLRTPGVYKIPEIYSRSLSRREQEVAALVVDGLHDNDIARRLNISQHTAKQYLKSVYRKLGVGSRVELTRLILLRALDDTRA